MKRFKGFMPYLLILLPLMYFAIFLHLDSLPFRAWDEAYLGVHTYEMMDDHDYIVTHSFGVAEMSNTKPPLVIWCMVLSSRILGFSELSIRLPNAIAGVIICILVFFFLAYFLDQPVIGFFGVLVLLSSNGFISLHVIRSGEYDALLTLFVFLFSLSFFLLLEANGEKRTHQLWLVFTISFIFAIWTKGIAAMMIVPGLVVYAFLKGQVPFLLKSRETYLSIFFILFFGLGYYFLREYYNPGYLRAVYDNELGGRYAQTNDGHEGPIWYYLDLLCTSQFVYWVPFALIGIISGLRSSGRFRQLAVFCTTVSLMLLIVLSISATKLVWYDAPVVPFLAILAAMGIYTTVDFLLTLVGINNIMSRNVSMIGFALILTAPGYSHIISNDLSQKENSWEQDSYSIMDYIKDQIKNGKDLNGYKVISDKVIYRAMDCEVKSIARCGQHLFIASSASLHTGDKVITHNAEDRSDIDCIFTHQTLDVYENTEVWQILTFRNNREETRSILWLR